MFHVSCETKSMLGVWALPAELTGRAVHVVVYVFMSYCVTMFPLWFVLSCLGLV